MANIQAWLSDTLDTSSLRNLDLFSLKGDLSGVQDVIRVSETLSLLISKPNSSMTRSISSVELDLYLSNPDQIPSSTGVHIPNEDTLDALLKLDAALADPAFTGLENVVIRFLRGAARMKKEGLKLNDTFPRMKAKADARTHAGNKRASDGFEVRMWDEKGDR